MVELSPLERRLAGCAARGEVLDCAADGTTPDAVGAVDDWDARLIRADVLELIVGGGAGDPDHPASRGRGVRLRGALIAGRLDLAHADLDVPIVLDVCRFEEPVELTGARLRSLGLTRCELPALWADELEVTHSLHLEHTVVGDGPVRLGGARVRGDLALTGARLAGTDERGQAFVGQRLQAGAASFDAGFEAAGAVRLSGAAVDGHLDMSGAKLSGTDGRGVALDAVGLHVGDDALLNGGFEAEGALVLRRVSIEGNLDLTGARLAGADGYGNALIGNRLRVGGGVRLRDGFEAAGAVHLWAADIGGQLDLRGARMTGSDVNGDALVADDVHVHTNALLTDGLEVGGAIGLRGARIDGNLALGRVRRIERLRLEGASCGSLRHDRDSWPPDGELRLRGFRFDELVGDTDWRQRLDWVRRQGFTSWSPDPYEQLAEYYTRIGDEAAARRMRIARHDDELTHLEQVRKPGSLAYRFWRRPFGWLVGYGYRRWPAGLLLVGTLLVAGAVFHLADEAGAMIPRPQGGDTGAVADRQEPCGDLHPCFNAVVYGADVVLPVVDFGQDSAWRPSESTTWGRWATGARWAFIVVGWVLASIFVAAFTRLVQRD